MGPAGRPQGLGSSAGMAAEHGSTMRTIASISGIFRNEVGENVFRDLVGIYPDGDWRPQHHSFRCVLPVDDPRARQVIDRLGQAGFHPWTETDRPRDKRHEYSM